MRTSGLCEEYTFPLPLAGNPCFPSWGWCCPWEVVPEGSRLEGAAGCGARRPPTPSERAPFSAAKVRQKPVPQQSRGHLFRPVGRHGTARRIVGGEAEGLGLVPSPWRLQTPTCPQVQLCARSPCRPPAQPPATVRATLCLPPALPRRSAPRPPRPPSWASASPAPGSDPQHKLSELAGRGTQEPSPGRCLSVKGSQRGSGSSSEAFSHRMGSFGKLFQHVCNLWVIWELG